MIAKESVEAVEKAVLYEFSKIVKEYGLKYASEHEAYAVLKEEVEEAQEALELLQKKLDEIWQNVKLNWNDITPISAAKQSALALAEEAVQCAAVCERFMETENKEK